MEFRHTVWHGAEMVYTSIGKVANTSIKTALLETFMPTVRRKSPHTKDKEDEYVTVLDQSLIASQYPQYLHMAVVRDPFDRMVSFFTDKIEGTIKGSGMSDRLRRLGFTRPMTFAATVDLACSLPDERTDPHIRSQCSNLLGSSGELLPDVVLRFERLTEDWALLSNLVATKTGAHLAPLGHRRVSVRRPCEDYYDDATRALVVERYRDDFDALRYPTRPSSPNGSRVKDHDDPVWAALGDRTGCNMLDLTSADAGRAEEVLRRSGHYLAPIAYGPPGQLNRLAALQSGRLPEAAFDVLVVAESQLARTTPEWLHDRFTSTGRTVVVTPEPAARRSAEELTGPMRVPKRHRRPIAASFEPVLKRLKPVARELSRMARNTAAKASPGD